ncbi:MAG TPA: hypothetical protein EYP86_02980 [Candidatus Altiarchaeales archaeon]|nr:hypothetical protein [Candidatus Altiarchaeales archaeon]
MAKKSRRSFQKRRKAKKPGNIGKYLILIIIVTMLLSVFYYTTMTRFPEELPATNNQRPAIDGFKIVNVLKSVRISVTSRTGDLVVLVENNALGYDTINRIKNSSISGVKDIIFSIGNPSTGEDYFTGSLIYIRFITDSINDNITRDIRGILDSNLGKNYVLYRGHNGKLPSAIGGIENTYILGKSDTQVGDVLRAITFEIDRGGISHEFISIEQKKIPSGPIVGAEISNITAIHVTGSFISASLEGIAEKINLTDFNIIKAIILVNSIIGNQATERLNSLQDTGIDFSENRTLIYYIKSLSEIESILNEEGLNYSLIAGSIEFKVSPNSSIENISKILNDVGVRNVTMYKEGTVIVPDEVIIDNQLIQVNNYKNLKAILKLESIAGQTIDVELNISSLGSIVLVLNAKEV